MENSSSSNRSFSLLDGSRNSENDDYQKRQTEYKNVVNELIHTEKSLVTDMGAIYDGYKSVIEGVQDCPSLLICFNAIKGIIETGNCLLEKIESSAKFPLDVAQIFNELAASIKTHYVAYCSNYPSSVVELERLRTHKEVNEKLKHIQTSLNHLLPLESYLLKPVQRIMKYPLLLKSIVQLNLLDEYGQTTLSNSQKNMVKVSEYINEKKREMEGVSLVDYYNSVITNLQEPLTVAKDGPVQLECEFGKGNKKTKAILFSKILILTKPQNDGKLSFHKKFPLKDIILLENSSKSPTAFEVSSYIKRKKTTTFEAKKIEVKEQWVTRIKALILENLSLNLNDTKLSALLGEKVGSQVSTILSVKEDVAQSRLSCNSDNDLSENSNAGLSGSNNEDATFANPCPLSSGRNKPASPKTHDKVHEKNERPSISSGSFVGKTEQELIEKASTAMNILETISDYNAQNEPDKNKRKLYENVPWSRKLIHDAMVETEQILEQDSDDQSSLSTTPGGNINKRSPLSSKSLIASKVAPSSTTPGQSRMSEDIPPMLPAKVRKPAHSDSDYFRHPSANIKKKTKHSTTLELAHRYESLESESYHSTSVEIPIVRESLSSRVQKLFEKIKTENVGTTTKPIVTPEKASLISTRLMQLQEKTMVEIELARFSKSKK